MSDHRPPASRPHVEVAIIACARWETQYIAEWLSYHRRIGFDRVYLYVNDDDAAAIVTAALPFLEGPDPFLVLLYFGLQGQQFQMTRHFLHHHMAETDWFMFLDIDEFLRLPDGNIKTYLAGIPEEWDSISFNWQHFGNSGFAHRPAGSVLLNYVRRESEIVSATKTLTRSRRVTPEAITSLWYIWHDWGHVLGDNLQAFNVLGDHRTLFHDNASYYERETTQTGIRQSGAYIHHYSIKSEGDFRRRVERGLVGDYGGQVIWGAIERDGGAPGHLRRLNAVYDSSLRDFWLKHLLQHYTQIVVPAPPGPNLLVGQKATQSSTSAWSRSESAEEDAAGAVNGKLTGSFQFHTELEHAPWWKVDLTTAAPVAQVRLFNRIDDAACGGRFRNFAIDINDTAGAWHEIYRDTADRILGGVDGRPMILNLQPPILCAGLRVRLLGSDYLHLDQVEAYAPIAAA
ncbi:glycosyltransferase family 2 protein [Acidisoma silvae]|uniref:Glycosyltransferase family 2 protein n=1 Tax=Acidisoma silvae TaxID=2802396 RepID=A0A964DXL1_9PROT|nr:glycosyltransferase family 2 protein [Acidisoma silvae]MCB8874321.1 glycosyltransferase family 2 protein [Acidisoma silvae]